MGATTPATTAGERTPPTVLAAAVVKSDRSVTLPDHSAGPSGPAISWRPISDGLAPGAAERRARPTSAAA
jgi:hypothetical protein